MKLYDALRFLLCLLFCFDTTGMFSKRTVGYDKLLISPSKRLRHNVIDMFLSNDMSALRAQSFFEDAAAAGASGGFNRLQRAGNSGAHGKTMHRDVLRKCLKGTKWPPPYLANIRVWDPHLQQATFCIVPIMLPHEQIRAICGKSNLQALLAKEGMSAEALRHLREVVAATGASDLLGLGFWLDGTPCNWDRSQSVETVSLNFPGHTAELANLRLPVSAIMKKFMLKHDTVDDILSIVSWSLQCALDGNMPARRHDGTPWDKTDSWRKKFSGKPIGIRSAAVEVRADWACLKETFRFPGWNEKRGCCYRCNVTPAEVRNCSADATWRSPARRLGHWGLLQMILDAGLTLSTLFSFPFFQTRCVAIDWLHCCDLGVACDFLGNLFFLLLPKMNEANQTLRVAALFRRIRAFYLQHPECDSRLDNLTEKMIRKKGTSSPKLRAKAAEARNLIAFAKYISEQLLSDVGVEGAVKQMARHLDACYGCLSEATYNAQVLKTNCRKFCLLWTAVETQSVGTLWRFKPKFHIWQELCEESDCRPSTCWTYRDEDFGGSVAKLARRRGGGANCAKIAGWLVINKFRAKHSVPAVL